VIIDFVAGMYDSLALDAKTRELVWLGIAAAANNQVSAQRHVAGARRAGAARDEIISTILMTMVTSSMEGVVGTLRTAIEVLDGPVESDPIERTAVTVDPSKGSPS
jgi:alkylhydroperoxidase/carboxymuconolactone decarboxylase family protein YurZ